MVKLYKYDPSPPARAAAMATEIFGVSAEMVDVDLLGGEHKRLDFLKINPLHLIPVMIDGDLTITDSHAILMYLADAYGKDDSLYPKDVKKRTLVNQKLFFNSGILFQRLRNVSYFVLVEGVKTMTGKQREAIIEAYNFTEGYLTESKFLAGDNMTIADIAAISTITSLEHLVPIDAKKYPNLDAWIKYMESLPYIQKYNKPGSDILGQKLKAIMT